MHPRSRSSIPVWVSRLPGGTRFAVDLILAVALAVATLVIQIGIDDPDALTPFDARVAGLGWLVIIGPCWAVPFRRIAPLAAVGVGAALQMVAWTAGSPDSFIPMAVLIYSAAAYGRTRLRAVVWAVVVILTGYTAIGVLTDNAPGYALPLVGLFAVAAAATGSSMAARQASVEAADARALELERSRRADRERALISERARIARELHDVVAHGLSVIVVQAAAARRILERDPTGASTALGQIEETGRNALNEMRHVLAAIRTEPDESWQPTRGLDDLDALVTELGLAGVPVTVEWGGPPSPDQPEPEPGADGAWTVEPLPATVDVTAYRIVQESLTNVLKHGGEGTSARVEIRRQPGELDLRITDDGRGALADDGGGHGLRGMQERVEVFGGRFTAGPRLGGGFTVQATLPVEAGPGPAHDGRGRWPAGGPADADR